MTAGPGYDDDISSTMYCGAPSDILCDIHDYTTTTTLLLPTYTHPYTHPPTLVHTTLPLQHHNTLSYTSTNYYYNTTSLVQARQLPTPRYPPSQSLQYNTQRPGGIN